MSRVCFTCKQEKDISLFRKNKLSKGGYTVSCKECLNKTRIQYYLDNPEKNRERSIKSNYGISMDKLKELYECQKGSCAICGKHLELFSNKKEESLNVARVDHDHSSGIVRGLLCNHCNIGLGHFKDNLVLLRNAVKYLEDTQVDD